MKPIFKFSFVIIFVCFLNCSSKNETKQDETKQNKATQKEFVISGKLTNLLSKIVYLEKYVGNETTRVDSVGVNPDGSFAFKLPGETPTGFYKVSLDYMSNIDIIFDKANVSFTGDGKQVRETAKFTDPQNNLITTYLNDYMKYKQQLIKFDKLDKTQEVIRKQFEMEKSFHNYVTGLIKKLPGTFAAQVIAINQPIQSPDFEKNYFTEEGKEREKKYRKKHFFDKVDFLDENLTRSSVFYHKVNDYFLEFYEEVSTEELKTAITKIMNTAGAKDLMNDFVLNIIYKFLEKIENFEAIIWMTKTHTYSDMCEEDMKLDMSETIEILKTLTIGKKVSDFTLKNQNDAMVNLYNVSARYSLLIFWGMGCDHCMDLIPKLRPVYNNYKGDGLEVVTVTFNPQKDYWKQLVSQANFGWINLIDPVGDNSPLKKSYHVVHTPKILLLDNEKKIVAKPRNYNEIVNELRTRFGY